MIRFFNGIFLILMMDCEQSARLTSESLDRSLGRSEIWALKIHQFCCRSSHRVARQMEMVAQALRERSQDNESGEGEMLIAADELSPDARDRIRNSLRDLS